jgi:hypothetical protein
MMFAVYNTIRLIRGDQNEEMTKVLFASTRMEEPPKSGRLPKREAISPSTSFVAYFLETANT